MLDRFTSMSIFICAADKRSFTAAAEMFGISATMVGKHVRFLEERVGAKLLNQTTRKQSLTEVGRIYYERCKRLLADAEAADACANEMRAAPRGLLKIHAPVSFGSQRLSPALTHYLHRYPEVDVDLTLADRAVDMVEEGYEAAIRIGPLADSGLIARALKPYTMWLCAAPAYLSRAGTPQTAQDLSRHNCLGFAYWQKKNVWRLRKSDRTESIQVKGRLLVNNGQVLGTAAIQGLGIIMQPEVLVATMLLQGIWFEFCRIRSPHTLMHIVYLADRRPTPKLRSFIDFVVESFG